MRRILVTLALTGAVLFAGTTWLDQVRASTTMPTSSGLHAFATTTPSGVFSPYPKNHRVQLEPVGDRAFEFGLAYIKRGFSGEGLVEKAGEYRLPAGVINIVSEQVRFEASLPSGMRPNFDRTIRHEYGHAFLYDLLADKVGLSTRKGIALQREANKASPSLSVAWPAGLRPVVQEYRKVARNIYQGTYYTASFSEYLAESYARYCAGQNVPPQTRTFLKSFVR